MIDFFIIILVCYMVLLLERSSTVNVGFQRTAFCSIDLQREKKMYAPFKYRPLAFWIARLFKITSKKTKILTCWVERYSWHIYFLRSEGLEAYYIYKYFLLLFASFTFYFYLGAVEVPQLTGTLILNLLICLTFIYDCIDYLLEIGFYSLFLLGVALNLNFLYFGAIAFLGSLNRETFIFCIPIAFIYLNTISLVFTLIGFIIGFVIPRYMYREPADDYDRNYSSGFKFLVFNPIKNWTRAIWPPLKQRFTGITSMPFVECEGHKMELRGQPGEAPAFTKEIFLNRIFLGVAFLLFCFIVFIAGYSNVPVFFKPLTFIFCAFLVLVSIPSDIREIRVYSPVFTLLIPYLLFL